MLELMNADDTARTAPATAQKAFACSTAVLQIGRADVDEFRPTPIEPSWILEGEPVARSSPIARSADGLFSCGRWECTAGRFHFYYALDEIIQILEGSVTIEVDGREQTLEAGDVAILQQGLKTTWTVHGYVKKFAIFRSQRRSLLRRAAGKAKRIVKRVLGSR